MNEKFLSACAGKTPYASKAEAIRVLEHRNREGRIKKRGRGKATTYRCRHCGHWHIGTESLAR